MSDTLKASIAELTGKKPADLQPEQGPSLIRSWSDHLADQGYTLKTHAAHTNVRDRHIIIYTDPRDGSAQAVLSDSPEAAGVTAVNRITVTKSAKTAKAGDSKEA